MNSFCFNSSKGSFGFQYNTYGNPIIISLLIHSEDPNL